MHDPTKLSMEVVFRVLKYIKSSPRQGSHSKRRNKDIECVRSITDWKPTSRYYKFLGGNLVIQKNNKQLVMTRSNIEVEFKVITQNLRVSLDQDYTKWLLSDMIFV